MDPTAALIVRKQTEFTRQFSRTRSTIFASTVANRFYTDNSLARQRRVVECTKRRQARAREKALEQEQELAQLQLHYEHKRRLRELQNQRETSRLGRKLQHVAAAYIQYVFRNFLHRQRARRRRADASRFLADFCYHQWRRHCNRRARASVRIQRHWRVYRSWQQTMLRMRVIQTFLRSVIKRRRRRRQLAVAKLQTCVRQWRSIRRHAAALIVQRKWRGFRLWRRVLQSAMESRQRRLVFRQDAYARMLQRVIGQFTVRCRLLRMPAFTDFAELRASRIRWSRTPRRSEEWKASRRQLLNDALAQMRHLQLEETRLRGELEELMARAKESRERVTEERERLRRFHMWTEQRRTKDDELMRDQLRDWETRKRFEIRMELERELELERRAQLRTQQLQQQRDDRHHTSQEREDARVEVTQAGEMARDELVALLARVRQGVSLDELTTSVPQIHTELCEIVRKRSHFLEDACAAVLKQSLGTAVRAWDTNSDSDVESEGTSEPKKKATRDVVAVVQVCVAFVGPLVRKLPPRAANEDVDLTRQRGVLVAFVLAVLGHSDVTTDESDNIEIHQQSRDLAALVVATGIDLWTILWTLRFRDELQMAHTMLLPTKDDDDVSDEEDVDDSDDDGDADEDNVWIAQAVANAAGLGDSLVYFLRESGQEYTFASWSPVGIVRLAVLATRSEDLVSEVSVWSSYSRLYAMGAVAQALMQAETIQTRRDAIVVLKNALDRCAPGGLATGSDSGDITIKMTTQSFTEAADAYRRRDWITPLAELVSNAMVSFPHANDRAKGLGIFRQLLQVVEVTDRFYLIRRLALRCPYGNVAAILVDQLRNDSFRVWTDVSVDVTTTPYTSPELTTLILDLLTLLLERDLKTHADLLASVASLIRFVAIRDKGNRTSFRTLDHFESVKLKLHRLQSRLQSTIAEVRPSSIPSSDQSDLNTILHDENARFVLVEAALLSTIDLLSG